jgi:hypothetical protein
MNSATFKSKAYHLYVQVPKSWQQKLAEGHCSALVTLP